MSGKIKLWLFDFFDKKLSLPPIFGISCFICIALCYFLINIAKRLRIMLINKLSKSLLALEFRQHLSDLLYILFKIFSQSVNDLLILFQLQNQVSIDSLDIFHLFDPLLHLDMFRFIDKD
jgi:hypothetical protein